MFKHPFTEVFPNILSNLPWAQLEVVFSSTETRHMGEEPNSHPAMTTSQIVVVIRSLLSLFFSMLNALRFLNRLVLQTLPQLHSLLWTRSSSSVSFLNWTQHSSCSCSSGQHRSLPCSCCPTIAHTGQHALGPHGHLGTRCLMFTCS